MIYLENCAKIRNNLHICKKSSNFVAKIYQKITFMKKVLSIFAFLCATLMTVQAERVVLGAEQTKEYLPLLKGKRVALLSNHTGIVIQAKGEKAYPKPLPKRRGEIKGDTIHTLDLLLKNGVNVTAIFSPEHGFRGTAREGELVASSVDEKTGIPILSLYDGKSKRPSKEAMQSFDVLITDIQDVGLRFYTYYVTMFRLMNACVSEGKQFMVFDRPNPNGYYVDGPILDMKHKSGVGALPIPVVHGMTLGELALMINGERWLDDSLQVDLTVIPCKNYTHQTLYRLPVAPSPNLRNMLSIYLYPAVCLFEATPVSLGRGTDKPFLCYGHPNFNAPRTEPSVYGPAITFTPNQSTQKGRTCDGVDLSGMTEEEARQVGFSLRYLLDAYKHLNMDNYFFRSFFELLVGQDYVRKMILQGKNEEEIRACWQDDVAMFKEQRRPYLLYKE